MNRRRDIDRVLDAWLVDGSSQMPDRLFEAVLDRVERTPQRRRPWSNLRVPPMTTRLFLASAAVIAIAVGAVGFAALNGPSDGVPPGSSPTPSPSPSSPVASQTGTLLDLGPREIRDYVWLAAPHGVEELGVEVEMTALIFQGGRLRFETGLTWLLQSDMQVGAPNELVLTSVENPGGCAVGDIGRYRWTLSPGGTKLILDHIQDDCSSRAAVLPGEWQRSACADPGSFCLGPLEAGRYASQLFDPFLPAEGPWKPRFGALTYEVPAGWDNIEESATNYRLARSERTEARIDLFSEVRAVSQADPCLEEPDPAIERSANALTDWLAGAPGVVSTDPIEVSVGGLDGWVLDLTMDPDWTPPCSLIDGEGGPYGVLFTDGEPSEGFSWHVRPGTQLRLYVLDLGDGRALLIEIEIGDTANRAGLIDETAAIVASMAFN
jgi:hypothetical protein